ncbi:MAG: VanW family protein [Actinomycetes bacterium]
MITDDTRTTLPSSPSSRARWIWLTLAVLLVLGVAYGAAAWALSGRVPAGVEVSGVQIGHMSRDAAIDRLTRRLEQDLSSPVPVVVGSAQAEVDPATAGLRADLAETVDHLVGFSLDPRQMWRHLSGDSRLEPVTTADPGALDAAVAALAEQVDGDVVEGSISFEDGAAVATEAQEGRVLDREGAAEVLKQGWLSGARPLELPAEITPPTVDTDAVTAAMDSFAVPATSGPLTVVVGDRSVELEPTAVTPALSFEAVDGTLEPRVDGEALKAAALGADGDLVTAPRDATVRIEGGSPVVVPGQDGTTIDPTVLAEAALAALVAPERTAAVDPVVSEPEVTTAEVQALGITEVVSQFATTHTADPGRTQNLRIAASTVNNTLLLPGETFSLNGVLGERTRAKGYSEAGVIMNGRLTEGVGGGVSQMATTLFNGMFFAGLEDVEHKPHSFYISRYPEGREATVNWPNVDLKFRNDTPHGVLIETWVGGGQVHTRFWSTKVWDEVRATKSERRNVKQPETIRDSDEDCVTQSPNPGFDVTVTRQLVKGGAVQRTDTFRTRYIPQDNVICES